MGALATIALASSLLASGCNDRSTKLTLIDRLPRGPEILILGSSRARRAEPAFLKRLTGHTGFNAAVTGGTAADAWVMTRYAADRFPGRKRRYLWFVDAGIATNGVPAELAADPRARRYLSRTCLSRYRADGSIAHLVSPAPRERARRVEQTVAERIANIRANPPRGGRVDPRRYRYFERAIAFMNARGERPVIVLNPIHPRLLGELRRYGFPARKTALAYLRQLRRRLDFVLVDCQDVRRWGGSGAHFANATHVDGVNMRRLLRYVVARSGGVLR